MKKSIVAALVALGCSFSVSAATLIPLKGVSVYFINGQEAESRIGKNELTEGENQVVVRMDKKVGKGSSSGVFTSAPYVLTFNVSGDEVKINHPVARSEQEAKAAFRTDQPDWRITQDGSTLSYSQEKLQAQSGFLPYMKMDELIAAHNAERGIVFDNGQMTKAEQATTATLVTTAAVATSKDVTAANNNAPKTTVKAEPTKVENVEQLKAWYLKASKEERKEFRKWMIDQE